MPEDHPAVSSRGVVLSTDSPRQENGLTRETHIRERTMAKVRDVAAVRPVFFDALVLIPVFRREVYEELFQ